MRPAPPALAGLAATLLLALPACIERPQTMRARVSEVDRSSLADVLLTTPPAPKFPVAAEFDEKIELVGLDVSPDPLVRGGKGTVTAYYRALEDVGEDWRVFVHIDDVLKNATRINVDHWPAEDRFRTDAWRKGDVVRDTWSFQVPASVDTLEIWTGFYQDEQRLSVSTPGRGLNDGTNRIRAALVNVR